MLTVDLLPLLELLDPQAAIARAAITALRMRAHRRALGFLCILSSFSEIIQI
jgi:hypothetical protein